jgi:hypothetical protein
MKISTKLKIGMAMGVIGYFIGVYRSPIHAVTQGLYDKGKAIIEKPAKGFYNWATNKGEKIEGQSTSNNVEQIIQDTYQAKTNPVSNVETNAEQVYKTIDSAVQGVE